MNTKTKNRSLVVVAIIALAVMAIEAIIFRNIILYRTLYN